MGPAVEEKKDATTIPSDALLAILDAARKNLSNGAARTSGKAERAGRILRHKCKALKSIRQLVK